MGTERKEKLLRILVKTASMIWISGTDRNGKARRPARQISSEAHQLHMSSGFGSSRPKTRIVLGTQRDLTGSSSTFIMRIRFLFTTRDTPLQWPPTSVGRYHTTDTVLISYLIRLGVEKSGDEISHFLSGLLFDKSASVPG